MSAKEIQNTAGDQGILDAYQPEKYCHPAHLGGGGITVGGPDADNRIIRSTGGGTDQTDTGQSGGESIA